MFTKIKQALCDHEYIAYMDTRPVYLSCGDEYDNRVSTRYELKCVRCDKTISVTDRWSNEKIRKDREDNGKILSFKR